MEELTFNLSRIRYIQQIK